MGGYNIILLYFSASWSPPCRELTPLLIESFHRIRTKRGDSSFEVVLIPLDTDDVEYRKYCQTGPMPWLSVPIANREAVIKLFAYFAVTDAPRLIAIDGDGEVLSTNARGGVGKGFGFGCDPVAAYDYLNCIREEKLLVGGRAGKAAEKEKQDS